MNRFMGVVMMSFLSALMACTKDERDFDAAFSEEPRPSLETFSKSECGKPDIASSNTNVAIHPQFVEGSIQASVAAARTLRVARALIDELVDGVVALDNAEARVPKLKSLARIVAQRPIDTSTPSNRSFSHEVRFAMGLGVFDGFVRLDDMDDAWKELLSLLESYRTARDEAKMELEEVQTKSRGSVKDGKPEGLRNAQVYYRLIDNGYEAAREFLGRFVLPHVTDKHQMPEDVAAEMARIMR